jgi:hypothetical protein
MRRGRWPRGLLESIDVNRSREVASSRIARKPVPMLVLLTLTVKVTVNFSGAASDIRQINSVESSLTIEWE